MVILKNKFPRPKAGGSKEAVYVPLMGQNLSKQPHAAGYEIFRALDQVCSEFDLGKPIWLDSNVQEFKRHAKVRFYSDSFIEDIEFDYLELQVIEED